MSTTTSNIEAITERALFAIFGTNNLTVAAITSIATKFQTLVANFKTESQRLRNFKFDPKWQTRVISVPHAVQSIQGLVLEVTSGLKEKFQAIAQPFEDFIHTTKLQNIEVFDPTGGPSKVVTAFGELKTFVSNLDILVGSINESLDAAIQLTSLFDRILKDIGGLEELFLQQNNRRKVVSEKSHVRVGKLHSV